MLTASKRAAGAAPTAPGRAVGYLARAYTTYLPALLVALGVALRAREYVANRSLWADEIAVAGDIERLSFGRLTHPLPEGQAAPIGWLWAERAAIDVFGGHALALRIVPFVASLLALALFPYVGRRLAGRWVMPAALLLFATAPQLTYYSSEVKQYSSDVACALIIVAVTVWVAARPPSLSHASVWAGAAIAVIWFSQPAILVTAVCGVGLAVRWLPARRGWLATAVAGLPAAGILAVDYFVSLRQQSRSTLLTEYWSRVGGYPPRGGHAGGLLSWLYHATLGVLVNPAGLGHPRLALAAGGLGLIVLLAARDRRWPVLLLAGPLLVAAAVGLARVYPLSGRLALYLLPFGYLAGCAGLAALRRLHAPVTTVRASLAALVAVATAVAVGLTGAGTVHAGLAAFGRPLARSQARQAVAYVAGHFRRGDRVLWEYPWAHQGWDYYAQRDHLPPGQAFDFVTAPTCAAVPGPRQLPVSARVWVFFDAPGSDDPADSQPVYLSYFASVGREIARYQQPGLPGGAYLFRITGSGPPPLPSWVPHGCLQFRRP